jgi:hypothetical protein
VAKFPGLEGPKKISKPTAGTYSCRTMTGATENEVRICKRTIANMRAITQRHARTYACNYVDTQQCLLVLLLPHSKLVLYVTASCENQFPSKRFGTGILTEYISLQPQPKCVEQQRADPCRPNTNTFYL